MASPSTPGSRAITIARGEVGYTETPRNITKYWAAVNKSMQGGAWCGAFVVWVWLQLGVDLRKWVWAYYVPYLVTWAKKIGAWKTSGQKYGDLTVYSFGLTGRYPHVGLAWPDPDATGYRAIEGNTSSGSAGSQSDGGGVYIRYRGRSSIAGWIDMEKVLAHYGITALGDATTIIGEVVEDATKPTSGDLDVDGRWGKATSQAVQQRLKAIVPGLAVDGRMGPASWTALQSFLGTPADGVISRQSHAAGSLGNGISARGWDHTGEGSSGSKAIRALQAYVGADVDGVLGAGTVKRLQTMLNQHTALLTTADKSVAAARVKAAGI